jgi:hypothetical protein
MVYNVLRYHWRFRNYWSYLIIFFQQAQVLWLADFGWIFLLFPSFVHPMGGRSVSDQYFQEIRFFPICKKNRVFASDKGFGILSLTDRHDFSAAHS